MINYFNPFSLEKLMKILSLDGEEIFSVLIQCEFPVFYYTNFFDLLCCHYFLPKSRIILFFCSFILSVMN